MAEQISDIAVHVERVYRNDSRRVLATLIRLLGDFDLAEESMQEAFVIAVEQWQRDGIPGNPAAWLVSTARFKAIDILRRRKRGNASLMQLAERLSNGVEQKAWQVTTNPNTSEDDETAILADDRLRLIFTCCHPALSPETGIALTLREVCGMRTEEIASAFLTSPSTIAQRIVRGKTKIREARIPYELPPLADLPHRLDSVLRVVYLVFNEGYAASVGPSLLRPDLSDEAIRLGRLLAELLPDPEVLGLLALMLLQESRRAARMGENGDLILLADQDRTLWNSDQIAEGTRIVDELWKKGELGSFAIQAALAAVHAVARTPSETDWGRVVMLYDLLLRAEPSPIVELNRAVAVAMRDGPEQGLPLIQRLVGEGPLENFHLAHAARAELFRQVGSLAEARAAYERAIALVRQESERRFLIRRIGELDSP